MDVHTHIATRLKEINNDATDASAETLNSSLRLLAKWRCHLIQNTLVQNNGTTVLEGPFAGMHFLPMSAEGCHIPKLLGCYEQPLHNVIEEIIKTPYDSIINIGSAEGYYSVGFARRMQNVRVFAYDLDSNARTRCAELAEKNYVKNRIEIGSLFSIEDFSLFLKSETLVVCDIEGFEEVLLDIDQAPLLKNMDMVVESHECLKPGITRLLIDRFSPTHKITLVEDLGYRSLTNPPQWFSKLAHLDQLLAVWEWRSGPTPWLVMRAHERLR